jgi:IMP dehydrogenase
MVPDAVDGLEGWHADEVFKGPAVSFNEVALLPGLRPKQGTEIEVSTRISKSANQQQLLKVPFVGAASRTVCETDMAIGLALAGSVGIIHRHQSVEAQAAMVRKVKAYNSGFILDVAVLGPLAKLEDVLRLRDERKVGAVMITRNGKMGGVLQGIVTTRDLANLDNLKAPVQAFMNANVVSAREPIKLSEARQQMKAEKVGKLPIVNKSNELVGLMTRGNARRCAIASTDQNNQLVVGAAVGCDEDLDFKRVEALVGGGVDYVFVDIDGGITESTVSFVKKLKETFVYLDVIPGPVSSERQARALLNAGCDALRVGGPGTASFGATMLYSLAKFARSNYGAPILAEFPGIDESMAVKAICLGASAVVLDSMLVSAEEAPGELHYHSGVRVKVRHTQANYVNPGYQSAPRVTPNMPSTVISGGSAKDVLKHMGLGVVDALRELGVPTLKGVGQALAQGVVRLERQMSCPVETKQQLWRGAGSALQSDAW